MINVVMCLLPPHAHTQRKLTTMGHDVPPRNTAPPVRCHIKAEPDQAFDAGGAGGGHASHEPQSSFTEMHQGSFCSRISFNCLHATFDNGGVYSLAVDRKTSPTPAPDPTTKLQEIQGTEGQVQGHAASRDQTSGTYRTSGALLTM